MLSSDPIFWQTELSIEIFCSSSEPLSISQSSVEEEITRENTADVDKPTHIHLKIQNRSELGAGGREMALLCDS